ncbi:MAG: PrgI family protein [Patescibacteria group bacterium]
MRFQVPQFIDIEDKIFGPLSFKQFIYIAGGAGGAYLSFQILPPIINILFVVVFGGLGLALAFYKVNERPLILIIQSAIKHFLNSKLYLWEKKKPSVPQKQEKEEGSEVKQEILPKMSKSKLEDLSWSLDVKQKPEEPENEAL